MLSILQAVFIDPEMRSTPQPAGGSVSALDQVATVGKGICHLSHDE
ncbi:hypothetical protein [Lentzea jiangxiensis]|uniref:Uncharacterized protein n=1 Tax=Lentzea jiangxiensis TaxID=641025 RepID=A0A1H0ELR6_9PSEU|nr:hypothetical protein [Lentzea jiangxiensis]SDN83229.1 hypothetical protein SAMN05421507_101422 [Lentzea jiangxiensis]